MRLLQYNIWDGCHDRQRYQKLHDFLVRESYDIVGFNELKFWTTEDLKQNMSDCGYPYTRFLGMESSAYSIGMASKYPIEILMTKETEPFHHGMLHVKIKHLHFIITHLSPVSSERREREAIFIGDYVKKIPEPLILMGDLNTLSPLDKENYEKIDLFAKLNATDHGRKCHLKDGGINYQPMQTLLDAGLHDVGEYKVLDISMPTKVHENYKERRHVRIDYVLVNDPILNENPKARVVRTKELEQVSDHYPVECELDVEIES